MVAGSSEGRALAAFVGSAQHRAPVIRAKAAAAMHKCVIQVRRRAVRRTPDSGPDVLGRHTAAVKFKSSKTMERRDIYFLETAAGDGGVAALGAPRDVEKMISTLPLLLQDGNLETRQHAKALTTLLLQSGLVPEARLRRAIPDAVFARLEREIANTRLATGPGFTAAPARRSTQRFSGGMRAPGSMVAAAPAAAAAVASVSYGGETSALSPRDRGGGTGSIGGVAGLAPVLGARATLARKRSSLVDEASARSGNGSSNGGSSSTRAARAAATWSPMKGARQAAADGGGGGSAGMAATTGANSGSPTKAPSLSMLAAAVADMASLPQVWLQMQSNDWREREAGLKAAVDVLTKHPNAFNSGGGKTAALIDRLCERLADGNTRVNTLALELTGPVMAALGTQGIEPVLPTLVPALVANAASTNKQLAALGSDSLRALLSLADSKALVQPLSSLAMHGNARVKVPALAALAEMAANLYSTKPLLVLKHVVPVAVRLAPENKADLRSANNELLRALDRAMGPRLRDHFHALSDAEQQRIQQVVAG
ncbi:unnamed protein product [Phaeothamnion confervicola]